MSEKKIDRKVFITWTLSTAGIVALGCGDDSGGDDDNTGGSSGSSGSGGAAGNGQGASGGGSGGTGGAGGSGAGGTSGSGGSGGQTGGTGGTGGAGGQTGGSGGGGAGGEGNNPNADCNATINVTITINHDHTLEIALADITTGVTKSYETGGAAPHTHWVQITAEDFTALQNGATIRKMSCDDGHEHEYIIQCFADTPEESQGIFDVCFVEPTMDCGAEDGDFCPPISG